MSKIDDILSNAALQEELDIQEERTPSEMFQFCMLCERWLDKRDVHQISRGLSHMLNQHTIVTDYKIVFWLANGLVSTSTIPENNPESFGFSLFFNLDDNKSMDTVWNLVWSVSCYNNGMILHSNTKWKNNWKEDTEVDFNCLYGEDILTTGPIANLLNVFWPRMMFYTEDLKELIFQTKNRLEIMEFRGFHRVRLNNRKYNTKEELIISGRDALEIQEKWWLGRSIINRYIFEANQTLVTETYADEVQRLLEYLVKNVDHSDKRCKLGNSHKMDEFVKGMTIEDIEGYDSIIIGTIRFLENITIDDDGNIIRL